jgi:hypothetical protein
MWIKRRSREPEDSGLTFSSPWPISAKPAFDKIEGTVGPAIEQLAKNLARLPPRNRLSCPCMYVCMYVCLHHCLSFALDEPMDSSMRKAGATTPRRGRRRLRLWASLGSLLAVGATDLHNHTSVTTTSSSDYPSNFVVCRITMDATLYQNTSDASLYTSEQTSCIPVIDQVEEPHTFTVDLPEWITNDYMAEIQRGSLHVAVSSATLNVPTGTLVLNRSSSFTILPDSYSNNIPRGQTRRLVDYTNAHGTKRYAMVRISTADSEPSFSAAYLRNRMTSPVSSMAMQFRECSLGQTDWTLTNVYDIALPNDLAFYDKNPARMRGAVVDLIQTDYQVRNFPSDIADHVLFCFPPGTGEWIANAATGHWRSQYNNRWCLSLSALVHELGHNQGLNHAGESGAAYGDSTSYMGSVVWSEETPKKCFNAAQHHTLGWYADWTLRLNPLTDDGVRVKVAAFVDANKAEDDEPVLLNFDETYYGQYNRAADFNIGTQKYKDEFVLIDGSEPGKTSLLAHLSVGESYDILNYLNTGRSIRIKVCESLNSVIFSADYFVIGIGRHSDPCSYDMYSTTRTTLIPSPAPAKYPTGSPVKSPSASPAKSPSASPVQSPSTSPVDSSTTSPTTVPTKIPSPVPTAQPSSVPSVEPVSLPTLLPTNSQTKRESTMLPSTWPSSAPSISPMDNEVQFPSDAPSRQPDAFQPVRPSLTPSLSPTEDRTDSPIWPSESPFLAASLSPTNSPSFSPTEFPTVGPSQSRTDRPTMKPSEKPVWPSKRPSVAPSPRPSDGPSYSPTAEVTRNMPSSTPSIQPTNKPFSSPPSSASPTHPLTVAPTPDQKETVVRNWELGILRRPSN